MKRRNHKLHPLERDIKKLVKDWLDVHGIFNWPLTQGLGSFPGLPDRQALYCGEVINIECKVPGGKLSPAQITFSEKMLAGGAHYVKVSCLEDLEAFFGERARG